MGAIDLPLFGRFKLPKQKTSHNKQFVGDKNNIPSIHKQDSSSADSPSGDNTTPQKKVRQRNGCFCCRKRRIKCTGAKPTCDNCLKASYLCVWPEGNASLPHNNDFKLIKIGQNEPEETAVATPITPITAEITPDVNNKEPLLTASSSDPIIELPESEFLVNTDSTALVKNKHKSSEIVEDALFRKFLIEINSSVISQVAPGLPSFPWMSPGDTSLYDAFVHGFITDISPQLTHFKLQPASAFIPSLIDNSMVQSLFCASGAAFLYSSSKDNDMKKLAQHKFIDSANKLNNYISTNDIRKNSGWIMVYLLVAYLKTRFIFEGQRAGTLAMISIIEAMKIWIKNKESGDTTDTMTMNESFEVDDKIIELNSSTSTPMDDNIDSLDDKDFNIHFDTKDSYASVVFHELSKKFKQVSAADNELVHPLTMKKSASLIIDPTSVETEMFMAFNENNDDENNTKTLNRVSLLPNERTMIESFVFNYSNLIFVAERSLIPLMTSPFIMFDLLRPYLSVPIYKCAVPWMNHPVVGAALPIVEIQAKVSWLGLFYPLSEEHRKIVSNIRSAANFYTRPILPLDVHNKEPENVQKKLLESCYAAEFVAKAVYIYSTKLLYPDMDYSCDLIQKTVEQAYENLGNITVLSQIHMILGFAFAVVGSVAIKQKHRSYLTWKLKRLLEVFSVSTFESMLKLYEVAWSKSDDGTRDKGWDVLLDPEAIKGLII